MTGFSIKRFSQMSKRHQGIGKPESKSFTKVAVTIVSMFSCRSMVFYVPMCLVHSMGHILQLKVRAAGPKTSAQDCSTNLYYLVIGVSK